MVRATPPWSELGQSSFARLGQLTTQQPVAESCCYGLFHFGCYFFSGSERRAFGRQGPNSPGKIGAHEKSPDALLHQGSQDVWWGKGFHHVPSQ
jgi:hypothetical protein